MVHEPTLRQIALDYPVKKKHLESKLSKVESYIQEDLHRFYSDSVNEDKDDVILVDEEPNRMIIGLRSSYYRVFRQHLNIDGEELEAVQEYYRTRSRTLLPQEKVETDILKVCTPVVVEMPGWWDDASLFLQEKLKHLTKQGLSPAEVLDLLAVDYLKMSNRVWAETRGVSSVEAVRKNARQAREKLEDSS